MGQDSKIPYPPERYSITVERNGLVVEHIKVTGTAQMANETYIRAGHKGDLVRLYRLEPVAAKYMMRDASQYVVQPRTKRGKYGNV